MNQDRRQFYRIDKWVALEFQCLPNNIDIKDIPIPGTFDVSPHFMLKIELQQYNSMIEQQIEHLRNSASPEMTLSVNLIDLLNQKIDIISNSLTDGEQHSFNIRSDRVNLSEGGLSMLYSEAMNIGDKMILKLIFPESAQGFRLLAEVKRCELQDHLHDIGLEFLRTPEMCRTHLARIIYRSQIEEHRAQQERLKNGEVS